MGCVCGKPSAIEDIREETPRSRLAAAGALVAAPSQPASKLSAAAADRIAVSSSASSLSRRDDSAAAAVPVRSMGVVSVGEKAHAVHSQIRANGQELDRRRERERDRDRDRDRERHNYRARLSGGLPRGVEGEQVAAGWPAWLASVAGEAIRGWVPRRADSFEKLDKIGQGTYSNVYRARDLDNGKVVALKKVRFDNLEPESVRFMAREIHILRRLDHPNVVKLEGLVTSRMSCSLYLVFEYMEHDLAGLASFPGSKFTEQQVKCYMLQLLRGLDHCHSRNILHRDIKGSNLLIDNNGILKIADFGLASMFDPDQAYPLTSRVVTLWYRPPELLLGATNYGVAVDLWSTGCILAELYAGKPIMPGRTEVEQLHKIFKLCGSPSEDYWRKSKLPHATIFKPQQPYPRRVEETFKDFPVSALALIEVLLSIDPGDRGTASSALKNEYFSTKPLACDPSSLPKYPPSKEFDAKIRDEEARRLGVANKVQRVDFERKGAKESRAVPAPDANAELAVSLQKRQAQMNSRSRSEKFNPQHEEASGFPIEPPRYPSGHQPNDGQYTSRASHSGPLVQRSQWAKAHRNEDDTARVPVGTNFPASHLTAVRGIHQVEVTAPSGRLSASGNEAADSTRKYDQLCRSHGLPGSHRKDDERFSSKDQAAQGYGPKGNKIHYSGPLMRPSGNVDQMLKDHDRQIQEVFRRTRHDKSKARKLQAEGYHTGGTRPSELIGGAPVFPSSRGAPVFPSSRGAA